MSDLTSKEDIILLIDAFYIKVKSDPLLSPVFVHLSEADWQSHLPIMYAFWQDIVFGTSTYKGNTMLKHLTLHQSHSLSEDRFKRWIQHFEDTVDQYYTGANASLIKQRAREIGLLMEHKIHHSDGIIMRSS